ncbi:MAG: hypothetical protein ABL967_16010, partial [Bryobacteraceae bacterium]
AWGGGTDGGGGAGALGVSFAMGAEPGGWMIAEKTKYLVGIGGVTVALRTDHPEYLRILESRFGGFTGGSAIDYEFDVELVGEPEADPGEDVHVERVDGLWRMRRGDFRAEWDPAARRGWVRQTLNPYAIDSLLRILHTLVLARKGGVLMHAASAIRNGKAFLFTGVSGAGKTTMSRLAPADATLLTDEISYVTRSEAGGYIAHGTPFAGELAKPGENVSAPLAAIYSLAKGPENRIEEIGRADAVRVILANILFFAHEADMVRDVFDTAWKIAESVPVRRLTFFPDERVWELIQ